MDSNKYKYLQRAIKRTHKFYIGDRNDGVATLEDLVKFFDIEIDSNRVSDMELKISGLEYDKSDLLSPVNFSKLSLEEVLELSRDNFYEWFSLIDAEFRYYITSEYNNKTLKK